MGCPGTRRYPSRLNIGLSFVTTLALLRSVSPDRMQDVFEDLLKHFSIVPIIVANGVLVDVIYQHRVKILT